MVRIFEPTLGGGPFSAQGDIKAAAPTVETVATITPPTAPEAVTPIPEPVATIDQPAPLPQDVVQPIAKSLGPDYSIGSIDFMQVIKNSLGISENSGKYNTNPNVAGAMGKYQFIPARLNELGYGEIDRHNFTPAIQEAVMDKHLQDLLGYAKKKGMITPETSAEEVAGLIWAGHLGGKGGMNDVFHKRQGASDAFGTSVNAYALKGANKFALARAAKGLSDKPIKNSNTGTEYLLQGSGDISNTKTSISDMFFQGIESAFQSQNFRVRETQKEIRSEVIEDTKKTTGIDLNAMMQKELANIDADYYTAGGKFLPTHYRDEESDLSLAFDRSMAKVKNENPEYKPAYGSTLDISQAAGSRIAGFQQKYERSAESATFTQKLAGIAGNIIGFMKDPINAASMVMAGAVSPVGLGVAPILTRGAINAAIEVPVQAALQPELGKVGLPSGIAEGAATVAAVGLGSVAFDSVISGVVKGAGSFFNGGSKGLKKVAEAFKTGDAGNTAAPIQSRVADVIGIEVEHAAAVLEKVPNAETSIGRQHAVESLDKIDTLVTNGEVGHVYPNDAVVFDRPISKEAATISEAAIKDLTPEQHKALKADADEWNSWKKEAVTGTEEQVSKTPIEPQKEIPAREQVYAKRVEDVEAKHAVIETPEYTKKVEVDLDEALATPAENLDFSILKTTEELDKVTVKLSRDQAHLDNWDQVVRDPNVKPHQKTDTARQHIAQRVEDEKVQVVNRKVELDDLVKRKEDKVALDAADKAEGVPRRETEEMILLEDAEGNLVSRPTREVLEEIHEERTAWTEFADCIKKGTN